MILVCARRSKEGAPQLEGFGALERADATRHCYTELGGRSRLPIQRSVLLKVPLLVLQLGSTMGSGGRSHGGQQHSRNGRYDLPAYGNTTSWRDDDLRVAVVVMLMAMGWIYIRVKGRDPTKGWLEALGFRGRGDAPGFARYMQQDSVSMLRACWPSRSHMEQCVQSCVLPASSSSQLLHVFACS